MERVFKSLVGTKVPFFFGSNVFTCQHILAVIWGLRKSPGRSKPANQGFTLGRY
jgi:hypothetical protein